MLPGKSIVCQTIRTSNKKNCNAQLTPFIFLKGVKPKEIHKQLFKVCKNSLSSIATLYKWVAELKRGCTSLEDN